MFFRRRCFPVGSFMLGRVRVELIKIVPASFINSSKIILIIF